jgi:hypothetical protein
MNISKYARTLAAGLAIGAAILSLPVGQAEAAKNTHPKDNGVRCMVLLEDGTMDFYLPGQTLWDPLTGKTKRCGADGNWHFEAPAEGPVAPKPDGGGVLGR